MRKIIFLDFDGVMDTDYYSLALFRNGESLSDEYGLMFDPYCVQNLKHIIEETGAGIVVSSTWKTIMSHGELVEMWKARELPGNLLDCTPTLRTGQHRGDEIDAWLNDSNDECQYVIIDDLDDSNFNKHHLSRLLVVDPFYGLDENTSAKAVAILDQGNDHTA